MSKEKCTACSGSGYYDNDGSPLCGACYGKGFVCKPRKKTIGKTALEKFLAHCEAVIAYVEENDSEILAQRAFPKLVSPLVAIVREYHAALLEIDAECGPHGTTAYEIAGDALEKAEEIAK